MAIDTEALRLAVYRSLAATGRAPDDGALAVTLGVTTGEVAGGLRALHDQRHLVLDEAGAVVLAHPFGTIDFGFSVKGERTLWWGGCVWDSFAIPNLVPAEPSVLVATTCPGCGSAHAWTVTNAGPPDGTQIAHFLVPVKRSGTTCCAPAATSGCSATRRASTTGSVVRGRSAATSPTSRPYGGWRARWYAGRLDDGYRRREPAAAAAYFREVGLRGAFWGLADG